MKKHFWAVTLICCLMLTLLSGCRKELPEEEQGVDDNVALSDMKPEEGARLVFWTGDKTFGEAVAAVFEEKYGVPVTVEEQGLGNIDKIALNGPSGGGADVFMSPHDSFQKGLDSGVFLKLSQGVVDDMNSRLIKTGIEAVTNNGGVYGVPVSIEVNCLFYNTELIDTPAATLEEIMEAAPSYNDPANNKFLLLCCIGDGYYEFPFLSSAGYRLFGEDGRDAESPNFDTDEFEQGLQLIADLKETIPITSTDLANKSSLKQAFMRGECAYIITGPWDVTQFKDSGMSFGITALPTYKGRPLTPFAGIQCAHVSTYSNYPVAASLFANFLSSAEAASIVYEKSNSIPALKDTSGIEGLAQDSNAQAFIKQFESAVPMPSVTRISYFWPIAQDIDKAVFDGQLTPAEGRQKAVDNWNALIATE